MYNIDQTFNFEIEVHKSKNIIISSNIFFIATTILYLLFFSLNKTSSLDAL